MSYLKVAVVVESFPKLSETFILNHIKGLIDAGVTVKIFAFNDKKDEKVHNVYLQYNLAALTVYKPVLPSNPLTRFTKGIALFFKSVWVDPLPVLRATNFFKLGISAVKFINLFEMATFITREKFDIVHCHFGTIAQQMAKYQQMGVLKAPLVTTFHGIDVDSPAIRNQPGYYSLLQKEGKLFLSNSSYTKGRLVELGFAADKIKVLPVSLDVQKFKRTTARIKEDTFRLITIGRLVEFKGIEYSLRAVAAVINKGTRNIKYTIIGEGPLKEDLVRLTNELGIELWVDFTGGLSQEKILTCFEQSDIFLLTGVQAADGRVENQGLVIQEAQAMEVPVIVSDIGGVSEGMLDGVTGYMLPQKNTELIAGKIEFLLSNAAEREKMGKAGRAFVQDKYSIEQTTRLLLTYYNDFC